MRIAQPSSRQNSQRQTPPEEPNTASITEGRVQAIVTDLQQAGFHT
jgi:hypothetical protein